MANTLGIIRSTLQRWITQFKNPQPETISANTPSLVPTMTEKEKRPQGWSLEERLKLIIKSDGLSDEVCNKLCRSQGVFVLDGIFIPSITFTFAQLNKLSFLPS